MAIQCPTCFNENPDNSLNCTACGTPLKAEQSNYHLPPDTILISPHSQYRIEKTLGVGGFGITYKGIDLTTSQAVAIKENWPENGSRQGQSIIWPSFIAPQDKNTQIQKVLSEAEYIHRCRHPNIVQVYDWFFANNTAYIIMEFLPGKTLYQILKEQEKLSEEKVKKYFIQISNALKLIHSNNLLHRDIKPDNIILVESTERAVLIDFGNAREFIANKTQKMTQILTAGYAPIEQYGRQGRRGATTDIYALCASIYELLTGQLPPAAPDRLNNDPLIPPRQLVPTLSPNIEQVILTGLQTKVENRYQTADDLIDGLLGNPPGLKRARQLVKEQKLDEAIQAYQQCLNKTSHGEATLELALILVHQDDSQAEDVALKAIQLNAKEGMSYGVLGLIYCRQGKWSQALNHLQTAAKLSPQESWIQANLAWAFAKLEQWTEAQQTTYKALQLNPQCSFTLGLQAWISLNLQEYKNTIRYSRQALFKCKQANSNQSLKSWVYPCLTIALDKAVITQQAPDLERCLQEFITQVPESGFPRGYQGWKLVKQGLWKEALGHFQSACQLQQVPPWVWLNLAITHETLQNIPQAINTYETYLAKFTPAAFPLFRLGTLLGQQQEWEKARNYLEQAIKLKPDYAVAYHNLGWVLLNLKILEAQSYHPRELLSAYRKAIELYEKESRQLTLAKNLKDAFQSADIEL